MKSRNREDLVGNVGSTMLLAALSILPAGSAMAADAQDGLFAAATRKIVMFNSVTRVHQYLGHHQTSTSSQVVIKGLNADGEVVQLTLSRGSVNTSFDDFMSDCAKKASLAMAAPSTLSFRYTIESGGTTVTEDVENKQYTVAYSTASGKNSEVRCTLAPAGDTSSDE